MRDVSLMKKKNEIKTKNKSEEAKKKLRIALYRMTEEINSKKKNSKRKKCSIYVIDTHKCMNSQSAILTIFRLNPCVRMKRHEGAIWNKKKKNKTYSKKIKKELFQTFTDNSLMKWIWGVRPRKCDTLFHSRFFFVALVSFRIVLLLYCALVFFFFFFISFCFYLLDLHRFFSHFLSFFYVCLYSLHSLWSSISLHGAHRLTNKRVGLLSANDAILLRKHSLKTKQKKSAHKNRMKVKKRF